MKQFQSSLAPAIRVTEAKLAEAQGRLLQLNRQLKKIDGVIETMQAERSGGLNSVLSEEKIGHTPLRFFSASNLALQARISNLQESRLPLQRQLAEIKGEMKKLERHKKMLADHVEAKRAAWRRDFMKEIESEAQELWMIAHTIIT